MKAGEAPDGTKIKFAHPYCILQYGSYATIVGRQSVFTRDGVKSILFDLLTSNGTELQWSADTVSYEFKDLPTKGN